MVDTTADDSITELGMQLAEPCRLGCTAVDSLVLKMRWMIRRASRATTGADLFAHRSTVH